MEELTKEQAAVICAYTGIMCGPMDEFQEYVEQLLGRPVYTHEFADRMVWQEIKTKSKPDFIEICRGA